MLRPIGVSVICVNPSSAEEGIRTMNCTTAVVSLLLTCALLLVGCGGPSSNPAGHDDAQLARAVAEDFLIVTGTADHDHLNQKAEPFTTKKFNRPARMWYEFKSWSITSLTMISGQTVATVRGSVQATKEWNGQGFKEFRDAVGFRMQLVKDQGKWLVDDIEFGAAPVDTKP